jgi:hypothetical protein
VSDKGIGFDRNIRPAWLDAAAAECLVTDDVSVARAHLMTLLEADLTSREGRLKTSRLLAKIWHGVGSHAPMLRAEALHLFSSAETASERIWLHHGMTMIAFPFFRDVAASVGRMTRHGDEITSALVRRKIIGERGQIAIIAKSVERSLFLMRQFGLLATGSNPTSYVAIPGATRSTNPELQLWLLAATVFAQPGGGIPAADLEQLPELFGFQMAIGLDAIRRSPLFDVQRQGSSWDLVRVPAAFEPASA